MTKPIEERLKIPIKGMDDIRLYTKTGMKVSNGYERVVIGKRGPYVEFTSRQLLTTFFDLRNFDKLKNDKAFYVEYRSIDTASVKLYFQLRKVDYADYKVGFYYISPFDLYFEGGEAVIDPLKDREDGNI